MKACPNPLNLEGTSKKSSITLSGAGEVLYLPVELGHTV